jgi:hypothetical protein
MSDSSVEKIRSALPPDQSKLFFGLVNTFGIHEDDDRLVVLAGVAMLLARADELTARFEDAGPMIAGAPEQVRSALTSGLVSLDSTVSEAIERSVAVTLDMMTNEVRSLVRELVVTEMTAASAMRTQAIQDEVRALSRAAQDVAAGGQGGNAAGKATVATDFGWMHRAVWALGGAVVTLLLVLAVLRFHH